ncbi:MAG: hypothetical protein HYR96_08585 [Deltaproteobacteria bacterium]|nr:hypothetical protein [Deltaproteobacteria bacterium]MBI3294668.1 hypothetical protein [Deltaproteobacteria bacterium]
MKILICLFLITSLAVAAPREEFLTTVQFSIHESSPELLERARNVVIDQFGTAMGLESMLANRGYQVRTNGNEVVLTLVSDVDLRNPMQSAVSQMIGHLNGRIHTRGGARFYRTGLSLPTDGVLDVVTDNSHTKILMINAQGVALRDVLKELKNQVGTFSYLIPGECSERFVEWSFGNPMSEPKSIDIALEELATLFGLKLAKQSGTYIFTGNCATALPRVERNDLVNLFPTGSIQRRLYFPVQLGE